MKPRVNKRLSWIELALAGKQETDRMVVDFSVFTDAELDRLEDYAERRNAWSGDDWFQRDLTPMEQEDIRRLVNSVPGQN